MSIPFKEFLAYLGLGGGSLTVLAIIILLFFPEKIQVWSAMLWGAAAKLKLLAGFAHKRYVKHDLEGRLNSYVKSVRKDASYLASSRVKVEWTEQDLTKKGFFDNGQVLLRLKRDDPDDTNFVHGAYWVVSTGLLHKAKRYISKPQREAVDLYVTTKVLEKEKPSVRGIFLDSYLHPKTREPHSKVTGYFDDFAKIDRMGYFYPVLLQELDYLGEKVFGGRKDGRIVTEVNGLIAYLKDVAERKVGDEDTRLTFVGQYCRVAIVIVGKRRNLEPDGKVYVRYDRRAVIPRNIETLFVTGRKENRGIIDTVCSSLEDAYERHKAGEHDLIVKYDDGSEDTLTQHLVVLRRKGIGVFQPSD